MTFMANYGLFLLKTFTAVFALLFLVAGILSMGRKAKPRIEINSLNEEHDGLTKTISKALGQKFKRPKKNKNTLPSLFVIDFVGDIKASQVTALREEITAILSVAKSGDEVLVRLDSPGGSVNGYGLAAAQLQRIKDKNFTLSVCIDKVAASGGYLMACLADRIIAAPFAIIGSIGVVAQIPNFHRWLKNHHVDIEILTAGEYKRTLTMFGENSAKGREKFQKDLEQIHTAFREYVLKNRPTLMIDEVATGEHWLALDAHRLKLVDALKTSDDFLLEKMKSFNCFKITVQQKQALLHRLLQPAARLLQPFG